MSNLGVFFNTHIIDASLPSQGFLYTIGNIALTPFRYLFHGQTIVIDTGELGRKYISKYGSKYIAPVYGIHNPSYIDTWYKRLNKLPKWIKTTLAIILLIPGLLLSALKLPSYFTINTRINHHLTKQYLSPANIVIGSPSKPLNDPEQIETALRNRFNHNIATINRLDKTLTIYGHITAPRLSADLFDSITQAFNCKKVFLVGFKLDELVAPPIDHRQEEAKKKCQDEHQYNVWTKKHAISIQAAKKTKTDPNEQVYFEIP
jgi:hypothetical protein